MECAKVQERLAGYLQDDLRRTERMIVEVHVAHCPVCRAELGEVEAILDTCQEALRHPAPENRYAELRAQLAAADRAAILPLRQRLRPRRPAMAAGIAAAFLLVAGASTPFLHGRTWLGPIEQAVDRAVKNDMSTVDRVSDAMNWHPAEDILEGDGAARDGDETQEPVAAYAVHE